MQLNDKLNQKSDCLGVRAVTWELLFSVGFVTVIGLRFIWIICRMHLIGCVQFSIHCCELLGLTLGGIPFISIRHLTSIHIEVWRELKGIRSYFSKFGFLFHLKNHHSNVINSKFEKLELKQSSRLDAPSNFVICSCIYLTV